MCALITLNSGKSCTLPDLEVKCASKTSNPPLSLAEGFPNSALAGEGKSGANQSGQHVELPDQAILNVFLPRRDQAIWADPQLLPRRLDSLAHGLNEFRFSRKVDELPWMFEILKQGGVPRAARVNTLYKRKADKVRSVDTDESDGTAPGGSKTWREDMLRKKRRTKSPDKEDLYAEWLIPKFSKIFKGSRLTPERIKKLIMRFITAQKKDFLIVMLFNRETALA